MGYMATYRCTCGFQLEAEFPDVVPPEEAQGRCQRAIDEHNAECAKPGERMPLRFWGPEKPR